MLKQSTFIQIFSKYSQLQRYCVKDIKQQEKNTYNSFMYQNLINKQNTPDYKLKSESLEKIDQLLNKFKKQVHIKYLNKQEEDFMRHLSQLELLCQERGQINIIKQKIDNLTNSIKNIVSIAYSTMGQNFKQLKVIMSLFDSNLFIKSGIQACQSQDQSSMNLDVLTGLNTLIQQSSQIQSYSQQVQTENVRTQIVRSLSLNFQSVLNISIHGRDLNSDQQKDPNSKPLDESYQKMLSFLRYDSKKAFDQLEFREKRQIMLGLCKHRVCQQSTGQNRQILYHQIFELLNSKGLLSNSYADLNCSQQTVIYKFIPNLIILLLMKSYHFHGQKSIKQLVQNKFTQFRQAIQKNNNLHQILLKNQNQFQLDKILTKQQNFMILQVSVYYIFNRIQPYQFKNMICAILKQKVGPVDIGLQKLMEGVFYKQNQNQLIKEETIDTSIILANQSSLFISENTSNIQDILYRLNTSLIHPQFNGYFVQNKGRIFFYARNKPHQLQTEFDIQKINLIDYNQVEGVLIPMFSIGNRGVRIICQKWKHIKEFYVWECGIQTLQGSGLENLKNLQILSLSNNVLDVQSAKYLLKHKWTQLRQLRITFVDGSQSWDHIITDIRIPFPKIKNIYARGLQKMTIQTYQSLYTLRLRGIYVFYRIQESLLPKLIEGGKRWIDIELQQDWFYFRDIHQKMLQNQNKIIQNQQKILKQSQRISWSSFIKTQHNKIDIQTN